MTPRRTRTAVAGLDILPGNQGHHVILFRVPPASVPTVAARDDAEQGEGWTCFGGIGMESPDSLNCAPWPGS